MADTRSSHAATTRNALHRHAVHLETGRADHCHRQCAVESVVPLHLDCYPATHFDRRTGQVSVVGPDARRRHLAVEVMRRGSNVNMKTIGFRDHPARRHRKRIDEWCQRSEQAGHHIYRGGSRHRSSEEQSGRYGRTIQLNVTTSRAMRPARSVTRMLPVAPVLAHLYATTNSSDSAVTGPSSSILSSGGWRAYASQIAARPEKGPTGGPTNSNTASSANRSVKAVQSPVSTATLNRSTCSSKSNRGVSAS